jgi:hypothetical protein
MPRCVFYTETLGLSAGRSKRASGRDSPLLRRVGDAGRGHRGAPGERCSASCRTRAGHHHVGLRVDDVDGEAVSVPRGSRWSTRFARRRHACSSTPTPRTLIELVTRSKGQ